MVVPIWSSANIGGAPLGSIPGFTPEVGAEIFDFTKKSGAEVIRLKGGAGRAVGVSIKEVVEAIALDSHRLLPVSSLQTGARVILWGSAVYHAVVGLASCFPSRLAVDIGRKLYGLKIEYPLDP